MKIRGEGGDEDGGRGQGLGVSVWNCGVRGSVARGLGASVPGRCCWFPRVGAIGGCNRGAVIEGLLYGGLLYGGVSGELQNVDLLFDWSADE